MYDPDVAQEKPLDAKIEERILHLDDMMRETTGEFRNQGLSERAIAGYLATIEYINTLTSRRLLHGGSADQEKFIIEVQGAIRTLTHGLLMGDMEQRCDEQKYLIDHPGKLGAEITIALRKANGHGTSGSDETYMRSETRL